MLPIKEVSFLLRRCSLNAKTLKEHMYVIESPFPEGVGYDDEALEPDLKVSVSNSSENTVRPLFQRPKDLAYEKDGDPYKARFGYDRKGYSGCAWARYRSEKTGEIHYSSKMARVLVQKYTKRTFAVYSSCGEEKIVMPWRSMVTAEVIQMGTSPGSGGSYWTVRITGGPEHVRNRLCTIHLHFMSPM